MPTHFQILSQISPTQILNIPLTFRFIYFILIVCYVSNLEKPKSQKCYTFRQIVFSHNRILQKNASEPLQVTGLHADNLSTLNVTLV